MVYSKLTAFRAQGGNDQPESVNQALHEAVTKVAWSDQDSVLKIIFLVGDAPPHMDYEDDVKYPETCRLAARKGIIINTIQCGGIPGTREIWQEIAKRAEGEFVALAQSGNMTVVRTPMDEELATLNGAVGKTIIAYGTTAEQREVWRKQRVSEGAEAGVTADRLAFNARTACVVQGGGDLLDALAHGSVKLEALEEDKLPENMKKMTPAERKTYVEKIEGERARLRTRIDELVKKRKEYIEAERKRLAKAGKGDSFDAKVAEILQQQAAAKGIDYEK
jgi:hypothetical protein